MIISGKNIEDLSTIGGELISPFVQACVRASSYDLTVGEEYYFGSNADTSTLSTQTLGTNQTFTIPPHAVCFVLAAESIKLPNNLTAKVSLRMSHIYSGMILSSQPPFDPGYCGRVIVMLHNLSSTPFSLKQGTRLATIEFSRVERLANEYDESAPPKSLNQRSVKSIQEQLPGPLMSSLVEISDRADKAVEKIDWLSGQMLTFAALIVAVLAVPGFFSYNSLQDRISMMNEKLIEQKEKIQELGKSVEEYKQQLATKNQESENLRNSRIEANRLENSPARGRAQ